MAGRIVEIAQDGRSVHLDRGFLVVRYKGETIDRIALDDIDAILASTPRITWSNVLLAALAKRGVPVFILGSNFAPSALVMPLVGHGEQGYRMEAQAGASKPLRKRMWATLVKAKILAQAAVLEHIGESAKRLKRLAKEVRSGDTGNREALAAQTYWRLLFGKQFRRDRESLGPNSLLNYGYAVLRAATARAIVAAGLHPSLSLHHGSGGDGLRLSDDLMEPFRPAFDLVVHDLVDEKATIEMPETKQRIVAVLNADYYTDMGRSPLSQVLVRLAQGLAACFERRATTLPLPESCLPLPPTLQFEPEDQ